MEVYATKLEDRHSFKQTYTNMHNILRSKENPSIYAVVIPT